MLSLVFLLPVFLPSVLLFVVVGSVKERVGERRGSVVVAFLVDDDVFAHEVQEAASVRVGVAG